MYCLTRSHSPLFVSRKNYQYQHLYLDTLILSNIGRYTENIENNIYCVRENTKIKTILISVHKLL